MYLSGLKYTWTRKDFKVEIKNHYNFSNIVESFNSWIARVRGRPVVDLVNTIRRMLMEQRKERKQMATISKEILTKVALDHIKLISRDKK
ncbi:hypothetical protein AXF42_Ash015604 [Apostasia shenzhenica]|uniref:Uncharacterized protein n=1 Tax=Apostasia shenzhenica TaxID=1088818 RepID=A0A2I0AKN1_9ASPA|nr:hypothetical protein AXF42_Ash015604 [Apostasia shenzhenica]